LKDKQQPVTGLRQLAPRYWLTWLGIGLMRLVIKLPYRIQTNLGRTVGRLFRWLSPYRRIIVETNLRLCFPELTDTQHRQLRDRCYQSLGTTLVETAAGLWAPNHFFTSLGTIEGLEHLETARREGKGVLLLSGHFCSVDFAGRILLQHYPACFTYQELRNRLSDRITKKARENYCKILIHRHDTRGFIRALKAGEVVWYAPDQDPGRKNSVFAPFFGIQTNTLTATTKLAADRGRRHAIPDPPVARRQGLCPHHSAAARGLSRRQRDRGCGALQRPAGGTDPHQPRAVPVDTPALQDPAGR
jgi:KDO2-lipid IV(A) lauroyltransferase